MIVILIAVTFLIGGAKTASAAAFMTLTAL